MRYTLTTLSLAAALSVFSWGATAGITVSCPGTPAVPGQTGCIVRGNIPQTGWFFIRDGGALEVMFTTKNGQTFIFVDDDVLHQVTDPMLPNQENLTGQAFAKILDPLLTGAGLSTTRITDNFSGNPDSVTINSGSSMISAFSTVTEGPAQPSCSMSGTLNYDFGSTSDPHSTASLVNTLPVRCTGTARGTLSLRGTPSGVLPLADSGVVATFSIKNQPLGGVLEFTNGITNVPITSTLSGQTTSTGSLSASGVLVLNLL
ncbi:Uncharacterised protein [Serratia quinivorans]|nr:Uncharacterised protein [Serratia quinivorans]CAI1676380.1 Uncharacterised protein [Serratia quinivorans]